MKITGKCQECKVKPALVGFKATIMNRTGDKVLLASGNKKLCVLCFQEALQSFVHLSQNLGVDARH